MQLNTAQNEFGKYRDPRVERNPWMAKSHPTALWLLAQLAVREDRMPTRAEVAETDGSVREAFHWLEQGNKGRTSMRASTNFDQVDPQVLSAWIREHNAVPDRETIEGFFRGETIEQRRQRESQLSLVRSRISNTRTLIGQMKALGKTGEARLPAFEARLAELQAQKRALEGNT